MLPDTAHSAAANGALPDLLARMIAGRQLTETDARAYLKLQPTADALTEERVLRWLAQEYGVSFTKLDELEPDKQVLSLFPARLLLRDELLPLRRVDNQIEIATSRLFATQALDGLKTLTGLRLRPVLAPSEAIQREMKKRLGVGADTIDTLDEETPLQVVDEGGGGGDNDLEAAEDASIIRFVNQVLKDAIELRASDIHLEPFEDELRIRYRIDGVLQDIPVPAQVKKFQPAIVARVKILSHLNIAEKRLPQDGRIKVRIDDAEIDIRVSIIPMLHGEAVVMRLLRQNSKLRTARDLGMNEREYQCLQRVLELPHGIVLVTGPTGSGKTSTLYTALNEINDFERKIITIEDPIEYQLKGVNQIQVSEKAGLTFARGLRSILRHDPDKVMVGEIRDPETAQIAIQSALTGHLVFTTVHANNVFDVIGRFTHMGLDTYNFVSALNGVMAQRLVRVNCPQCVASDTPDAQLLADSQAGEPSSFRFMRGRGCAQCRGTGFRGRKAIGELLPMNDEMRELIVARAPLRTLKDAALSGGTRFLRSAALDLVRAGETTLEEINRVTFVA